MPVMATQAERTAVTRAKLLDAAAACLAELGYGRTSSTEICRRAGVSRGAQLHHFPTKADLVSAALDHVFERRVDEFRALVQTLPNGPRAHRRRSRRACGRCSRARPSPRGSSWSLRPVPTPTCRRGCRLRRGSWVSASKRCGSSLFPPPPGYRRHAGVLRDRAAVPVHDPRRPGHASAHQHRDGLRRSRHRARLPSSSSPPRTRST